MVLSSSILRCGHTPVLPNPLQVLCPLHWQLWWMLTNNMGCFFPWMLWVLLVPFDILVRNFTAKNNKPAFWGA